MDDRSIHDTHPAGMRTTAHGPRRARATGLHTPVEAADLLGAVWAYRRSALVTTLILIPVFLAVVIVVPNRYDSYAQIFVRLGRGTVSMDATASLSPTVSLQDSRASQVNSVKEMLQSRAVAQAVVREVGADRILQPRSWIERATVAVAQWNPFSASTEVGNLTPAEVEQQILEEQAITHFQKAFNLNSPKDAYTIDLEVRTGDPFLSRDLLAALLKIYQRHHAMAHRAEGSAEFFAEQADRARHRALTAKEALRAAKTERGMIDVSSSQAALQGLISQVENDLVQSENQLAATRSRVEKLVTDIEQSPEMIQTEVIRGIPKTTGTGMRQRLYDLEVEYNELAVKSTGGNPKLRALRDQLDAATKIAQSERGEQPQTREAINPVRQQLDLNRRQAASELSGLEAKLASLSTKRDELLDQLEQLNRDEVEIAQLRWEADLAEREYLRAAENRDNARLIDRLSSGRVSEIAVVQEASLGLKKVKPRRSILAVLFILLAGTLGIFQALVRGMLFGPGPLDTPRTGPWEYAESADPNRSSPPTDADEPAEAVMASARPAPADAGNSPDDSDDELASRILPR